MAVESSGIIKFSLKDEDAELPLVPERPELVRRLETLVKTGEPIGKRPTTVIAQNLVQAYEQEKRESEEITPLAVRRALKMHGFVSGPWVEFDGPPEPVKVVRETTSEIRVTARRSLLDVYNKQMRAEESSAASAISREIKDPAIQVELLMAI